MPANRIVGYDDRAIKLAGRLMSGMDELLRFLSGFGLIASIVGASVAYYSSVRRARRKDLPRRVRSRGIAALVLHTIVIVGVVTFTQLESIGFWPDSESGTRWIVGFGLAVFFAYVILGIWSVTDEEYNARREEEFEKALVELKERQGRELVDSFIEKIAEGADLEELQDYQKKAERRRKRESNRLVRRFADE